MVVLPALALNALAEFQSECYQTVTTAKGSFRKDRYETLRDRSHAVFAYIDHWHEARFGPGHPGSSEELGAVFCAIQNMYLTATACASGCYLSTGGITYMEKPNHFFGWGPEDKLVGFLHVRMPARWPAQRKTQIG